MSTCDVAGCQLLSARATFLSSWCRGLARACTEPSAGRFTWPNGSFLAAGDWLSKGACFQLYLGALYVLAVCSERTFDPEPAAPTGCSCARGRCIPANGAVDGEQRLHIGRYDLPSAPLARDPRLSGWGLSCPTVAYSLGYVGRTYSQETLGATALRVTSALFLCGASNRIGQYFPFILLAFCVTENVGNWTGRRL